MGLERVQFKHLRSQWMIPLLMAPVLIGVAVFAYLPAWEAIRHSFFNWDGQFTEEFVGLENFRKMLGKLHQWGPFLLSVILLGLSAILDEFTYRHWLRAAGLLALAWTGVLLVVDAVHLLGQHSGEITRITLRDLRSVFVLLGLAGGSRVFSRRLPAETRRQKTATFFSYCLPLLAALTYMVSVQKTGDRLLWMSFRLILILVVANLFKMWPAVFTAVCIHRLKSDRWQYVYRVLFVIPMIIPQMVGLLIWKFFYDPNVGVLNKFFIATRLDQLLIWLDQWVLHLGVFQDPFKPAWLGDEQLIVSALVLWGFPWVGVVGVLIYLAGLQNISNDVYEAAEIDGVGWWGRFAHIEFPLILTQVRLNLILMIIGTFQAYGFQLILLGAEGGPGNKGLTPGLYMYFQAFQETNYGYACAIGLMLFFIILILTVVNQKYVRVKT